MHETCCPGQSCLWTIQVCPGALALSELQGSSIWMSLWLSWQSLPLESITQLSSLTAHMQEQVGILLHKPQRPHKAAIYCPGSTTETPDQAEAVWCRLGEESPVTSSYFWSVVLLPSLVLITESQNCWGCKGSLVTTAGLGCPWCSAPYPNPLAGLGCTNVSIIRAASVQEADSAWLLCTAGTSSLHCFWLRKEW